MEPIIVVTVVTCIFMSFYFVFLSFQTTEESLKKQLATLATFSLIIGVILFSSFLVHLGIRKAFLKVETRLESCEKTSEDDENGDSSA